VIASALIPVTFL